LDGKIRLRKIFNKKKLKPLCPWPQEFMVDIVYPYFYKQDVSGFACATC